MVAVRRFRDVTRHPILRDFAAHGNPKSVAREVEDAVATGSARVLGNVVCTDRLLVQVGLGHAVVRFDDIAWAYRKNVKLRVSFIPAGTLESVEVFTYGPTHRAVSASFDVDQEMFEAIRTSAPKARLGFTPANETWWRNMRANLEKGRVSAAPDAAREQ